MMQSSLLLFVATIVGMGTVFYHLTEGWGWLDTLYFSVVALTTIDYGDILPRTRAGKLFTIAYILFGLGTSGSFITSLASQREARRRI